jgi:hypothetical protein
VQNQIARGRVEECAVTAVSPRALVLTRSQRSIILYIMQSVMPDAYFAQSHLLRLDILSALSLRMQHTPLSFSALPASRITTFKHKAPPPNSRNLISLLIAIWHPIILRLYKRRERERERERERDLLPAPPLL